MCPAVPEILKTGAQLARADVLHTWLVQKAYIATRLLSTYQML